MEHVKNGVFGLRGHVCAFEQDINEFSSRLPRSCNDIDMIRVEQTIRTEIGGDSFSKKNYLVRRSKVIKALVWLKKNNVEYFDIEIDVSALDWIGKSDSAFLKCKTIVIDESRAPDTENDGTDDLGPNPVDGMIYKPSGDEIIATGLLDNGGNSHLSVADESINNELQAEVRASKKKKEINMKWPKLSEKPVNEYSEKKVFALAFPWLFPGGFGDPKDFPRTLGQWGSMMMFYEDARFATDKIFSFFALNYIVRHRNSSSGRFFLQSFPCGGPETLKDLKETITKGDHRFINSLTYFNKRVHGSNSYWMQKRSEVYAWINHHVEVGNGAPMFFITLSCAEYFWADVVDMLKQRIELAGQDSSKCKIGHPGFVQLVNDYAIVVQEYFQERVVTWLDTVGKAILGIKHYWIRYEFTPGRGQIHAHLLAIPEDQGIYKIAHDAFKGERSGGTENSRADILSKWAKEKFNLTAEVDPDFDEITKEKSQPCTLRFSDLENNEKTHRRDQQQLLSATQMHACSKFCMRPGRNKR